MIDYHQLSWSCADVDEVGACRRTREDLDTADNTFAQAELRIDELRVRRTRLCKMSLDLFRFKINIEFLFHASVSSGCVGDVHAPCQQFPSPDSKVSWSKPISTEMYSAAFSQRNDIPGH